jgi:hypothetical protein
MEVKSLSPIAVPSAVDSLPRINSNYRFIGHFGSLDDGRLYWLLGKYIELAD